ncbi:MULTISPECIES: hypothetical protein [unclassified Methylophilus]|uniref:hypothetical protein n=1 Tax=unclassified Methylophilus TaxID=2630143 RepID=UPI0006F9C647|nr:MULTISPECIES: hypothetical protein [unclassified Methylophilus]KQT42489.1 hypothetical protein ASG34_07025 [Methylophilus sp. Leaf416]KQT56672.1 hypothetical protein ASG44_07000 [Methylophilus sp. Leaf459]
MNSTLKKLYELSKATNIDYPFEAFEPVGLILLEDNIPYESWDSDWCALPDQLPFAITGVDGVYFSLLGKLDEFNENSPVVMTIPNSGDDNPNVIVGENLIDFLSLGCKTGYHRLDDIVFNYNKFLKELESKEYDTDFEDEEIDLLIKLINKFQLKPWSNYAQKLKSLQTDYADLLVLRN